MTVKLLLLLLLLLSGCVTTPGGDIHYYLLTPTTPAAPAPARTSLSVGIGPVELPEYLSRPYIFTQTGTTQLQSHRQHRWAGSLENNFTDTLAAEVGARLHQRHIEIYPWDRPGAVDRQVVVHVTRFIAVGRNIHLDASWQVLDRQGERRNTASARLQKNLPGRASADDFDAIVTTMSELVGELAKRIAASL
jgi:uncharacterized protein